MIRLGERSALHESGARVASLGAVTFECHGTVVCVRSDDETMLALLRRRLPPGACLRHGGRADVSYRARIGRCRASGSPEYLVVVRGSPTEGARRVARTTDVAEAVELLAGDVEFRVALHAPAPLFVHAAAVAWAGRVIALPGSTFTGKTTMTAALLRAGAQYYSDEFTVVDEAGLVLPFPRPLHVRSPDGARAWDVRAEELGTVGTAPLPLGAVVATTFRAGARWRPRPMTPGETALVLLDNAVVARTRPVHAVTRIAQALDGGALGLRGRRGEADDAARRLLDWAGRAFT